MSASSASTSPASCAARMRASSATISGSAGPTSAAFMAPTSTFWLATIGRRIAQNHDLGDSGGARHARQVARGIERSNGSLVDIELELETGQSTEAHDRRPGLRAAHASTAERARQLLPVGAERHVLRQPAAAPGERPQVGGLRYIERVAALGADDREVGIVKGNARPGRIDAGDARVLGVLGQRLEVGQWTLQLQAADRILGHPDRLESLQRTGGDESAGEKDGNSYLRAIRPRTPQCVRHSASVARDGRDTSRGSAEIRVPGTAERRSRGSTASRG